MKKESFKVFFNKGQICTEIQCEYQQLKKQVAKLQFEIPFDCLLLIDQNKQVYSATQLTIQRQIQQSLSFQVYDVREIFKENLERYLQCVQGNRQKLEQNQFTENQAIQDLKVKLYDYDQQIQKQNKRISELQKEFFDQKAELEQKIKELNYQMQSLIKEKQKNESNFRLLIDEKIYQNNNLDQQIQECKKTYQNELEGQQKIIQQIQSEIEYLKSNHKQDIATLQEKHGKILKQLEEELSQKQLKIRRQEQEQCDMQIAYKEEDKQLKVNFAFIMIENNKLISENCELIKKVESLTQKLNDLQNSNSKNSQIQ